MGNLYRPISGGICIVVGLWDAPADIRRSVGVRTRGNRYAGLSKLVQETRVRVVTRGRLPEASG